MNIIGSIVRIASTVISDLAGGGKAVDATIEGSGENTATAQVYGPHGIITRPAERTTGVRLRIGRRSIVVAVVNYGVDPPENPGETSLYSTDSGGAEQARVDLCSDGKIAVANQAENLYTWLQDFMDELVGLQTAGSPTNHTVNPASIAALEALRTRLDMIMKEER